MNTKHLFCLSGWGYLQDIVEKSGKFIAVISMLTHSGSSQLDNDDVQLDCEVNNEAHKACLKSFLDLKRAGKCVMLNFLAEYSSFINVFSGQAPDDPKHMITLQTKLRLLKSCSINGSTTNVTTV